MLPLPRSGRLFGYIKMLVDRYRANRHFGERLVLSPETVFPHFRNLKLPVGDCLSKIVRYGDFVQMAPMESFFNSLKNERTHHQRYATREEARQDTFEYIEVFYNRSRRHSALGYQSPAAFYATWLNQQKLAA
jgi:hypothetical protein